MYWIARDGDGNIIRQYDESGKEHYISELYGKKILSVGYYDDNNDQYYLASLITGNFYFPNKTVETEKDLKKRLPILKRRHTVIGNIKTTEYIFGFDVDGKKVEANTENEIVFN